LGLNLAIFGPSQLELKVTAEGCDTNAEKFLALGPESNFLLTTIFWGNVAANCPLLLLTDSVITGVYAFVFSFFGVTFLGEIIPQAWFSRNALSMDAKCVSLIRL
jgi:metal transporter CNNM